MPTTIEATSPATQQSGDAQSNSSGRSGNLSTEQAAQLLSAFTAKSKVAPQPNRQSAPEETAPASEANAESAEVTKNAPNAEEATAATSDLTQQAAEGETTEAATETPEGAEVAEAAEPEAETEPVHSQTTSFTPEQQALFNKRLGKEVAKTKAIKAQMEQQATKLAELESKLKAAPSGDTQAQANQQQAAASIVIPANTPLGDVHDIATLGQKQQAAKEAIRYVEEVLDDQSKWKTVTDPNDPNREIEVHQVGQELHTRATLKAAMRNAKVTLEDHIPARAQFLATRQQASQQAVADFPWLSDKQSPNYQLAQSAKRDQRLAVLHTLPDSEWLIGALVEGMQAMQARKTAAAKPADKAPAKPKLPAAKPSPDQVATSASGAASRAPIGSAQRQALAQEQAKLSKKGGIGQEDAAKLLLMGRNRS